MTKKKPPIPTPPPPARPLKPRAMPPQLAVAVNRLRTSVELVAMHFADANPFSLYSDDAVHDLRTCVQTAADRITYDACHPIDCGCPQCEEQR